MWQDIGRHGHAAIAAHGPVYRRWVAREMSARRFIGWVVTAGRGGPVAGSGAVWLAPQQPRVPPLDARAIPYILSMYTEPEFRRRGVAGAIVRAVVDWARRHGYPRVTLHAAPLGRSLYASLGFERSWEMRIDLTGRRGRGASYAAGGSTGRGSGRTSHIPERPKATRTATTA